MQKLATKKTHITLMSRGGKREGAGRKPLPPFLKKQSIHLKLPGWLIDWMDQRPGSRAVQIEEALKRQHKLKEPKKG